ncbi:MAG: hypothetical protein H5U08_08280, partial [Thermogutta sp.]|nr:hypothetical protein [Thermogutta sp.]
YVVTDAELPEVWREKLTSAGVQLILASVAESAEEPALRPVLDAQTQFSPLPTHKV